MKVIKKDGRVQEFDEGKLYTSLFNASSETEGAELNESDIKMLIQDIVKSIKEVRKDESYTSSYEIKGILVDILYRDKFKELLKAYLNN